MKKVRYRLEKSGDFVIENYNFARAFSSFFPGIAGLYGIPMWAFYVNRGQCLASFGTRNKDGAIVEFYPANQAYNLTAVKGFRTFIKSGFRERRGPEFMPVYEPFREMGCPFSKSACRQMRINPYKLEIEEQNHRFGLKVNVVYITVPDEPYAAIARCLTITNISDKKVQGELLDGLPQVVPYGVNQWCQKYMSRTIEAWMQITNLQKGIPFYALKVDPQDEAELKYVARGNFYLAYKVNNSTVKQLDVVVEPALIFGEDSDLNFPRAFAQKHTFSLPGKQRAEGKTPSAFTYAPFFLKAGHSMRIISVIGNIDTAQRINKLSASILQPEFFSKKLAGNKELVARLQNSVFTESASPEFDFYTRQAFLDNLLRGGYPHSIKTPGGPFVFYLYARKHGDLERDYNAFNLLPSYFSQGNGAYRDINQNRRSDILFNPDVNEDNIRTFVNALQPDGFNPQQINGLALSIKDKSSLEQLLQRHITRPDQRREIKAMLLKEFTPGEVAYYIETENIATKKGPGPFLEDLLASSSREDIISHGEGFWVDHWTYNLDLIENYLAVYPERQQELLFKNKEFTFYDNWHRVASRDEKYVYVKGKIRQFGSVLEDEEKKTMIASRKSQPHKVRTEYGRGDIYRTTLFVKLLMLVVNKTASLDPFGIGIEMEADRPGWCDSLNNMPAVFGSSVSETAELKRLVLFLKEMIGEAGPSAPSKVTLPEELADFSRGLAFELKANSTSRSKKRNFIFWDKTCSLKENYRRRIRMGFSGKEKALTLRQIEELLDLSLRKVTEALKKSLDKKTKIPYSYFMHKVRRYKFTGRPAVKALSFGHQPIPYFLEAPMHMMKVLEGRSRKRRLYDAVRKSALFDRRLKMYKLNAPLKGMPLELGRSMIFTPGWLENESIWLHMEYKYLLEVLRAGLYEEFFSDIKKALVAFMKPEIYGRSILENSSFIVSSAHPQSALHGRGFVARLSGSTTEFLSIWLHMAAGRRPFRLDSKGRLCLVFEPALPRWLFTKSPSQVIFYRGQRPYGITIPGNSFAFTFLGKIAVIYRNPKRKNTYGEDAVRPQEFILKMKGGRKQILQGACLPCEYARAVRNGLCEQIEVLLG